jgi:cytochrome b
MILSYLLAALIVVHIAGALRHHFIKQNDMMRRMWLGARPAALQDADQPVGPAPHSAPAKNLGS